MRVCVCTVNRAVVSRCRGISIQNAMIGGGQKERRKGKRIKVPSKTGKNVFKSVMVIKCSHSLIRIALLSYFNGNILLSKQYVPIM